MIYRRVAAPTQPAVSLADIKRHCAAVDFDDDDALLSAYVAAAESFLDGRSGILGRALLTQSWEAYACPYDVAARGGIEIKLPPINAITSVSRMIGGVYVPLPGSAYVARDRGHSLAIRPAPLASWPSGDDDEQGWRVAFVAGYPSPDHVPAAISQAIRMLVAHWYATRESVSAGVTMQTVPFGVHALIAPHRVMSL